MGAVDLVGFPPARAGRPLGKPRLGVLQLTDFPFRQRTLVPVHLRGFRKSRMSRIESIERPCSMMAEALSLPRRRRATQAVH